MIGMDVECGKAGLAVTFSEAFRFRCSRAMALYDRCSAVLAVWAARKGVATPEVMADFHASRDFGMSHIAEISSAAARELELPADKLESYLRDNIDFSSRRKKIAAAWNCIFAHAAKLGLIPKPSPSLGRAWTL